LDVARAANYLLRMIVNGDLVLSFKPRGFFAATARQQPADAALDTTPKHVDDAGPHRQVEGRDPVFHASST
jgi:hypothetical protein